MIGQTFTDAKGNPIAEVLPEPPVGAGDGYDPTATGASNLGPESIVDTLPNPTVKGDTGTQSLLTQVCTRSLAGRRSSTASTVGARTAPPTGSARCCRCSARTASPATVVKVVSVNQACPATPFISTYDGVPVSCATFGGDYAIGKIVPIHGPGKAWPANPVPPDAVTASGSGLDPDISPGLRRSAGASGRPGPRPPGRRGA